MTNHSKTISNSMRLLGVGATTKWSTGMTWGTSKWGEGSAAVSVQKFINVGIANSLALSSDVIKYAQHLITNTQSLVSDVIKQASKGVANSLTFTEDLLERRVTKVFDNDQAFATDIGKEATKNFTTTLACSADLESIKVYDNAGYADNFPGGASNARDRVWDNWTSVTTSTDGFVAATDATTTWSES